MVEYIIYFYAFLGAVEADIVQQQWLSRNFGDSLSNYILSSPFNWRYQVLNLGSSECGTCPAIHLMLTLKKVSFLECNEQG